MLRNIRMNQTNKSIFSYNDHQKNGFVILICLYMEQLVLFSNFYEVFIKFIFQ